MARTRSLLPTNYTVHTASFPLKYLVNLNFTVVGNFSAYESELYHHSIVFFKHFGANFTYTLADVLNAFYIASLLEYLIVPGSKH